MCPTRPITLWNTNTCGNFGEGYMEIQKSFHALNNFDYTGSISFSNYNVLDVDGNTTGDLAVGGGGTTVLQTGANSYKNGFALATELETFAGKSSVLMSGINTLAADVFLDAQIGIAPTTVVSVNPTTGVINNTLGSMSGPSCAYVLDMFAHFDIIFQIDNGLITSRF